MAGVRSFEESDVPRVADLVWKVLHERPGSSPAKLQQYFSEVFLHNPWLEEGIPSKVYEDSEGKLVGFFGVVPRRMTYQGKVVRLAFGSNFVMDPESRASMAAIQLVRGFMKGPQDISITDSANENSRQLLRSLGFTIVPIYSLLWARPLRPCLYGLQGVARLRKKRLTAPLGAMLKPLCSLGDALITKVPLSPFRQVTPETTGSDLDTATLLGLLSKIPARNWLLPEYDANSLDWTMRFVSREKAFGTVRSVAVQTAENKIIGWYIYYVAPGAIGETLQIGAESASVDKVLRHLFHDAWQRGLVGIHGRLEPQFMQELTLKSSFFLRNGSWTLVHSARPELANLIQSGTAFFSRLDGEWALRPGMADLGESN
jgi:hypothetical protein